MLHNCGADRCIGHLLAGEKCFNYKHWCGAVACPGHSTEKEECLLLRSNFCGEYNCPGHRLKTSRCPPKPIIDIPASHKYDLSLVSDILSNKEAKKCTMDGHNGFKCPGHFDNSSCYDLVFKNLIPKQEPKIELKKTPIKRTRTQTISAPARSTGDPVEEIFDIIFGIAKVFVVIYVVILALGTL